MKAFLMSLVLLGCGVAFADGGDRPLCTPGQTWEYRGEMYVCSYTGYGWEKVNAPKYTCREGTVSYIPVNDYQGDHQINARAVCHNGKFIFDNDKYNYRPTRGLNRCQEGRIWEEGRDRGTPGITYVCHNGRAVAIP